MYLLIAISVVLLMLFLVWASADVGSNVYLKTICRADTKEKVVALTFDDGVEENTTKVLDVLKKHNIQATFFLVGSKVEKHPHIVKRIVNEGHIVANHTYSHSGFFPTSSKKKVEQEITKCADAIQNTVGKRPVLFRPPFGVTNPIIGKVVRALGLKTIGWSIRSLDTVKGKTREEVAQKVLKNLHAGAIILLHDRCQEADSLVENIIEGAHKQGYVFASLDKMINVKPYEN